MCKIYSIASIILYSIILNKNFSYNIKSNSLLQVNSDTLLIVQDTVKSSLSHNIDKVVIEYWDPFYADYFIFNITNNSDKIIFSGESIFIKDKIITSKENHNRLINYINELYIDKKKDIVLKKIKRDYFESTNYPSITIIGFRNNTETLNTFNQIGDEVYDVKYNPYFLEFINFLDEIINSNNIVFSKEIDRIDFSGILLDQNNKVEFKISINNHRAQIINYSENYVKTLDDSKELKCFIDYINKLYIDQTDETIPIKKERLKIDVYNFNIQGFKGKEKILEIKHQIDYPINSNSIFKEFLEFLNHIVKE